MAAPLFERDHWKTAAWEVFLYNPAPGVLHTRISGYADLVCVTIAMNAFDAVATTADKVDAFHDWELVTGYEAEARPRYVAWSRAHAERVSSVHILIRSKLVAMAISVANLALGGYLTAHSDRSKFELLRAEHIARRRREAGPSSRRSPSLPPPSGVSPLGVPPSGVPPSGVPPSGVPPSRFGPISR